jgi:hypothetical protein
MAGPLEMGHEYDLQEIADMEAFGRGIKPDI